jgi:hypothetical protein
MTSQVNPNNIDGTYPVAGQDNDSQGFRDNFTNIRNNFTFVKAEIEDMQNKAIFKTALNNTTLDNEFAGNIISNPSLTAWRETYNNIGSASGSVTVNFANGNFQKITMAGSMTLSFSFPANTNNQLASIKLWIVNPSASYTLTLPSAVTLGDPDTIAGLSGTSPPIITFSAAEIANNTNYLFEFFTVDGGTTIGIKDLIRNRDVDLSGFTISGNLSLDNISASGNLSAGGIGIFQGNILANSNTSSSTTTTGALVVRGGAGVTGDIRVGGTVYATAFVGSGAGGNVVAPSGTDSTSSTTGALVVIGGAGISANVNIDGNLWINSGNIRSTSTTANIFNISMPTISMGNAASDIFMGASSGSVRAAGNVVVGGNLNAAGNVVVGGNLTINGGIINTDYLLANVVTGQNLFANVNFNRFIANASPTGTVANLFITLPNSVEDGRLIDITTMTAITSCFVSNMTPGVTSVYGLANNWATSASFTNSVSIKLLYNASVGRWFKVG